jgi:phosphoribosylaminoimidazole-succinocarboxamide synthase
LKENDQFRNQLYSTTKADNGEHDADISEKQILCNGIVTEEDMSRKYTRACFKEEQKLQQ